MADVAEILHLGPYLKCKPKAFSGGQRQRVAIGRAIGRDREVFLLDEPFSDLDAALRVVMQIDLTEPHDCLGAAMIHVTHDQVEAMTMADKIVVWNGGDIEEFGAPMDLFERPATPFVAFFNGSPEMNLRGGRVAEELGCGVHGLRPEHLPASETEGRWSGQVRHVARLGADTIMHIGAPVRGPLAARVEGGRTSAQGDTVWARQARSLNSGIDVAGPKAGPTSAPGSLPGKHRSICPPGLDCTQCGDIGAFGFGWGRNVVP